MNSMEGTKKQTTLQVRSLVISHYKEGKSQRDIARIINRSRSTVEYIIRRYVNENRIANKPKKSSKRILSDREERWILREVKKNPKMSAPKLAREIKERFHKTVHAENVRRILRKNNLHGRIARKKPFISQKNKKVRLEFAQEHLNKDLNFWSRVLFTDESKFNIFGSDGKQIVWRAPNEQLKTANLTPTVKHGGGSVMVWGCMSAAGVGKLHFIEGIMDRFMYLDILKQNLKSSAEKLGILNNFIFYQDNDPKHKSSIVRKWLIYNCPKVLDTPPQSPDLNLIENLWHELKVKIQKYNISNKHDLKRAIAEEWANISPSYTGKLVKSMNSRLRAVEKNKGGPTKY